MTAPTTPVAPGDTGYTARWWHRTQDGRLQCDLCPRHCRLRDGQRGFCFVRQRCGERIVLTAYGRSTGLCLDPVEKKPLGHVHPGSSVLSFGTAGCNLSCKFCQNWEISTACSTAVLSADAPPAQVAHLAEQVGARAVALTYNDPVVFAEYAIDTAAACHERGLLAYAVSAGWICQEPGLELFGAVDAANIDLKGFTDDFYRRVTGARLKDVQDTLVRVRERTSTWLEVTTLLIPGLNDSPAEVSALSTWVSRELGADTPLHFSAFHPSHRMLDRPRTPPETLRRAREVALAAGLHFVYIGNVRDEAGSTTYCPGCGRAVIERAGYTVVTYALDATGACTHCGRVLPGLFDADDPGDFGTRRIPLAGW
ncbi:AmmeMemoRadiSam system radical SAM enzyme [Actinomyces sp. MRS3W]|uniref:AmmeMemoRadiSam system radical SAM enzyme n=1 Tax=Actinomyces sp. MRS3W TaxID=2800796 RepID=UPI0028FD4571|nr:AmmeMemoRadiSam system radical SAM enzyme [Actinomyces sp. MRS3W]MDU0347445.1 AmmeMemoRadiSam system radical SAM enzyme [Actinomyces sp. MRS3W]